MRQIIALWLAALLLAAQPVQAAVCVGFGQSAASTPPNYESYAANFDTSTEATTLNITKPTGTVEGDLLVAVFAGNQDDITCSGWTVIDSTAYLFVLSKTAGGSEPASYTFSHVGTYKYLHGAIARISGNFTDVDGSSESNNPSWNTTVDFPTQTETAEDSLILWIGTKPVTSETHTLSSVANGTVIYSESNKAAAYPLWIVVQEGVGAGSAENSGTLSGAVNDKYGSAVLITP